MSKNLLQSFAGFLILAIGALAYWVAPHVTTPKFIVKNQANVPVKVTAYWKEKSKDLGELSPGAIIEFEVTDEAAMAFKVIYPNYLKMLFLREIKVLEARQRLEALVIPKRQALTRHQGLLAPLLQVAEMAFPQQLKTSIFR